MTKLCYVCEGGDCTEKGSGELFERLQAMIREKDPQEARVKVRRYPCFGACEQGINVTVYPDKLFYSEVGEDDLQEVAAHVQDEGEPVERLLGKVEPDVEQIIWDMLDSPY
ncbi:MAG: (2Fe-2S) ferredoxin domain-containing protein [Planctomycetota bacterium]|nr:(2Fe-2S) ferredoxin domain-containing protein [Planctomycetota bacterium]